jgi:hypothetical protein
LGLRFLDLVQADDREQDRLILFAALLEGGLRLFEGELEARATARSVVVLASDGSTTTLYVIEHSRRVLEAHGWTKRNLTWEVEPVGGPELGSRS